MMMHTRVSLDLKEKSNRISMPTPTSVEISYLEYPGISNVTLVDLDGILYAVIFDVLYTKDRLGAIIKFVRETYSPPTIGVMFYNIRSKSLDSFVFVEEVNKTFSKSSCGSGSIAVAASLARPFENGFFSFNINQPGGILHASIQKEFGKISSTHIDGLAACEENIKEIQLNE